MPGMLNCHTGHLVVILWVRTLPACLAGREACVPDQPSLRLLLVRFHRSIGSGWCALVIKAEPLTIALYPDGRVKSLLGFWPLYRSRIGDEFRIVIKRQSLPITQLELRHVHRHFLQAFN